MIRQTVQEKSYITKNTYGEPKGGTTKREEVIGSGAQICTTIAVDVHWGGKKRTLKRITRGVGWGGKSGNEGEKKQEERGVPKNNR